MKKIIIVGFVVFLLLEIIVLAQDKKIDKNVVAKVNGVVISRKAWQKKLEQIAGRRVLDQMINEELLRQEIKNKKVKIDEKEVKTRINELKKQFGTEEEFNMALKQQNIDIKTAEESIRMEIAIEKLLEKEMTDKEIADVVRAKKGITKEDAKRFLFVQKFQGFIDKLRAKAKIEINL